MEGRDRGGSKGKVTGGEAGVGVRQNWALSPSRVEQSKAHSIDLSRILEKTKLHCSPQMEASVSWVTALISSFLLLPLLSGAIIGGLLSAAEPASKPGS